MTNKNVVVEELNTLLRGTYMGVRSFEHYIQHVKDAKLKHEFQSMQQETKHNAEKLSERIQNLDGVPANSEGASGRMHSFIHNVVLSDDSNEIIKDAIKGADKYGVEYSEEVAKGDLDQESKQLVEEVIDTNRRHAEHLRNLLQ